MNTKQINKGFTLIELLVVIAIIGVLSAIVLASLGSARNKGTDSAIVSILNQMRTQGELYYNGAGSGTYGLAGVGCDANIFQATGIGGLDNLIEDLKKKAGGVSNLQCEATAVPTFAVSAKTSTGFYCVDSRGSGKSTTTATLAQTSTGGLCN